MDWERIEERRRERGMKEKERERNSTETKKQGLGIYRDSMV
jgi:hypothetical protein